MHNSFLEKAVELNRSREAYAIATIIRRKIPSSGKPGDRAIITSDGLIHGWIGGGCTRGIVLKEALLSIQDRKPSVIVITPTPTLSNSDNTKIYSMTCQSGGEVEVYIEPVLPKPHIIIMGNSHIGMALCKLAKAMEYRVDVAMTVADTHVFPEADRVINTADVDESIIQENSHIVVCTQGEGDVTTLYKALSHKAQYLALVASRKKANGLYHDLRQMGIETSQLKTINTPAGIDIGAKLPEEVAISILAQIIEKFRISTEDSTTDSSKLEIPNDDYYLNPVCNIPIQKSTAKHVLEYKNEKVYFCCDGCKVSFEKTPEKYIA